MRCTTCGNPRNAVIVGCYDQSKINLNDTLYVPNYLNGRTVVDIGQTFNGIVNVETGDVRRVKSLLEESGVNVSNIDFVDPRLPKLDPSADASDIRAALKVLRMQDCLRIYWTWSVMASIANGQ